MDRMKKFTITNPHMVTESSSYQGKIEKIVIEGDEDMQVSDSYHTMNELYEHRITLFIALCKHRIDMSIIGSDGSVPHGVWRSKLHADSSSYDGWFIMGIGKEKGRQISYHLPMSKWEETNFAETLDRAPEWDDHTPEDVLQRLKAL
jgi:hypothetical protein